MIRTEGRSKILFPGDPIDFIVPFFRTPSPIPVIRQKIDGSVGTDDHIPDPSIFSILKILCKPPLNPFRPIPGPLFLDLDSDE